MNLEELKEKYLSEDYAREQNYILFREDIKGVRYYIKVGDGKKLSIAPSVTSITSRTRPLSQYLIDWMIKNGAEKADWFKKQSADYGTFLHVVYSEIITGKIYEMKKESLLDKMKIFFSSDEYDFEECMRWYRQEKRDIQKDIYSFLRWVKDYEVEPIAVEYPIMSTKTEKWYCREVENIKFANLPICKQKKGENKTCEECENEISIMEVAGAIDLVCLARLKKGEDKQRLIVDWKTGLKAFYDEHAIQLKMYQDMWNNENPDYIVDQIWNFAPNRYRLPLGKTAKYYSFKNQTENEETELVDSYLKIFHMQRKYFNFSKRVMFSDFEISSELELTDENVFISTDIFQEVMDYINREEF